MNNYHNSTKKALKDIFEYESALVDLSYWYELVQKRKLYRIFCFVTIFKNITSSFDDSIYENDDPDNVDLLWMLHRVMHNIVEVVFRETGDERIDKNVFRLILNAAKLCMPDVVLLALMNGKLEEEELEYVVELSIATDIGKPVFDCMYAMIENREIPDLICIIKLICLFKNEKKVIDDADVEFEFWTAFDILMEDPDLALEYADELLVLSGLFLKKHKWVMDSF